MTFLQKQSIQFLDFFTRNGVDLVNLAVLGPRKSGNGECMKGDSRPRGRVEVEKSLAWAMACNMKGCNVYFRPARYLPAGETADHPIVFLDDVDAVTAERVSKKYRSIVVETSLANFQAWIITRQPLSEYERHQAQARLSCLVGADAGSTSGEHFGRYPGFKNQKPGRNGFWIKVAGINNEGPLLDVSPYLSPSVDVLADQGKPQNLPQRGSVPSSFAASQGNDGDQSAHEFRYALSRLAAGQPAEWVIENITQRALERGKRRTSGEARKYAEATVNKAARAI